MNITKEKRKGKVREMMNELLVVFGITSIIFIPLILIFIFCGVDKAHKIGGTVVVVLIWIVFTLGLFCEEKANEESWNQGFCECGTHWELKGVSKGIRHEVKYYACPNCYSEIEINC